MTKKFRGEAEWVDAIQDIFVKVGAFDYTQRRADAVRIAGQPARANVDCAIAGRHFYWPSKRASDCGYRAVAAALSDLAAVGADPREALLSAVIPAVRTDDEVEAIERFFQGAAECFREFGVRLLGGNVSEGPLAIHTTVLGDDASPRADNAVGAAGDLIWLTGTQGDAALQLYFERAGAPEVGTPISGRFWRPQPRLDWGRRLWALPWVCAVTDISDGWLKDARRLISDARLGLELDADEVPRSPDWRRLTRHDSNAREASFWGGEDYELAFLSRGIRQQDVAAQLLAYTIEAACVGQVIAGADVVWKTAPEFEPPPGLGYDPYLQRSAAAGRHEV